MNGRKKITALFLAMMMALSIMAMPATALENEIQPRIPSPACPYCNQGMDHTDTIYQIGGRYFIYTCRNDACDHKGYSESLYYPIP